MFKECANISEVTSILARVYALGNFRMNTLIGCMEQQETKNPDEAQLVLGCGRLLESSLAICCTSGESTFRRGVGPMLVVQCELPLCATVLAMSLM